MFGLAIFGFAADRLWGPLAQRVKQLEDKSHTDELVRQKLALQFEALEKAITKLDQSIMHLSAKP
jgi:hypothetical protein